MSPGNNDEHSQVFQTLRGLLVKYAADLVVQTDTPDVFYLNTPKEDARKRPIYFGSVHIKRNYVSFYLMPVYCYPDLMDSVSPELQKRMQGKSCFNFKKVDKTLFDELQRLTAASFERYGAEGMR